MTTLLPPTAPPDGEALLLADDIRSLHRQSNQVRAELLERIGRFDEFKLATRFGAANTVSWLERELRFKTSTAYEYVGVARKLPLFPLISEAFRAGAIDYTTVRLLLRHATSENEAELVDLAQRFCYAELEKALAGNEPDRDGEPDAPFLKAFHRADGMLELEGLLPPMEGQAFLAALKIAQLVANGVEVEVPEEIVPPAETEPGEVSLEPEPDIPESCPGEQTKQASELSLEAILGLPSRYGPPTKADMYPAFLTMINMIRTSPHAATRAPGAQVTVMLTEDGKAWMPDNPQAPSSTLRHYVANAMMRGHLLSTRGLTMHFGRSRRYASDGQVQALLSVWGNQCAMPGCTHSRFLEIHHIEDWAVGGETNIENLIPLCSSCHSKVSHGIASITQRGCELEFRFLDGSRFVSLNRLFAF